MRLQFEGNYEDCTSRKSEIELQDKESLIDVILGMNDDEGRNDEIGWGG